MRVDLRLLTVCSLLLLLGAATVRAHELGTTRVSILLHEGQTYDVEIVTDAAALVEKLDQSSGQPSPVDPQPERLQSLLIRSDESFRRRVKLAFDGSDVRPLIAYAVSPGADAVSSPVAPSERAIAMTPIKIAIPHTPPSTRFHAGSLIMRRV